MRPHLIATALLAALTLAASNQFGGGSFGGSTHGRANRFPTASSELGFSTVGPGVTQFDATGSTDDGDPCFPGPCEYIWTKVYDVTPALCSPTTGTGVTFDVTRTNATATCIYELTFSDGSLSDTALRAINNARDRAPVVACSMSQVTEPDPLVISCSVSDFEGKTCGSGLDCTHTMLEAPAGDAGDYVDATAEDTSYTPTVDGIYRSQLCADDGVNDPVCADTGPVEVSPTGSSCAPESDGYALAECFFTDEGWTETEWFNIGSGVFVLDAANDEMDFDAEGATEFARAGLDCPQELPGPDGHLLSHISALDIDGDWNYRHFHRVDDETHEDGERYAIRIGQDGAVVPEHWADSPFTDLDTPGTLGAAISAGDYIGTEVVGTGTDTVWRAWLFGSYPGLRSTWGTPDAEFMADPGTDAVDNGDGCGNRLFITGDATPTFSIGAMAGDQTGLPPVAMAGGPYQTDTGSVALDEAACSDPNSGDTLTYEWTIPTPGTACAGASFDDDTLLNPILSGLAEGADCTVQIECDDGTGNTDTDTATVERTAVTPVASISPTSLGPVAVPGSSDASTTALEVENVGTAGSTLSGSCAVLGTPDDATPSDGSAPNSAWIEASGSFDDLAPGDSPGICPVSYDGSQGCEEGTYDATVRATTTAGNVDVDVTLNCTSSGGGSLQSSITIERDPSVPIGRCAASGSSCTQDSQCGGSNDFCVMGACADDGSLCVNSSQCGGAQCVDDITFNFDKDYLVGQFASGDHWVQADAGNEVVISSVTPPHTSGCEGTLEQLQASCRHGMYTNPGNKDRYSDGRIHATQTPGIRVGSHPLPHTVDAGSGFQSVHKAISTTGNEPDKSDWMGLLMLEVLTVVPNTLTPDPGDLRPGVYGTPAQKLPTSRSGDPYNISEIDLGKLPSLALASLATQANVPAKAETRMFFSEPEPCMHSRNSECHGALQVARGCRDNVNACNAGALDMYHGDRTNKRGRNYLALLFDQYDWGVESDKQILYNAIQEGLDAYSAMAIAPTANEKGYFHPAQFASFVLGDTDLSDDHASFPDSAVILWYDTPKYASGHPGDYLWGRPCSSEEAFLDRYCEKEGSCSVDAPVPCDKWGRDAYGYRDGIYKNVSYFRIHMGSYQGFWMLGQLLQMQSHGVSLPGFYHGFDRFYNGWDSPSFAGGKWVGSDSCTTSPSGTNDPNPETCAEDGSCECASGGGRSTEFHGFTGTRNSEPFAGDVFDAFKGCAGATYQGAANASFPCSGMAE